MSRYTGWIPSWLPQMPFTDNHQLDLDWILAKMRDVLDGLGEMVGYKESAEEAASAAAESATEAAGAATEAQSSAAAASSSETGAAASAAISEENARQALTSTPISTDYLANSTVVNQLNTLNTKTNDLIVGDITSAVASYLENEGLGLIVNQSGGLAIG